MIDALLDPIAALLTSDSRHSIVADACKAPTMARALERLRTGMRRHRWMVAGQTIAFDDAVAALDRRARDVGFHALHDWDGKAEFVNDDAIAVDVLNLVERVKGREAPDQAVAAILLDYYFIYLLALAAVCISADGQPGPAFARLNDLVAVLQGPSGSGQRFVNNAETLMLVATSHYEATEDAYDRLLSAADGLDTAARSQIAFTHAISLGCHLRFGFEATYGKSMPAMRDDNGVDYRWLSWSLGTIVSDIDRAADDGQRERLMEALVNGLSADALAFLSDRPPASLSARTAELSRIQAFVGANRNAVRSAFARLRPRDASYSPLSLFFNFAQNVLKGSVVDAVLWGEPCHVSLDDLFAAAWTPADDAARRRLATALMTYARSHPDLIRGRLTPVIVYDPAAARRALAVAAQALEPA